MHKAISISSFSPSNGDPNQALNGKHQLYLLHFKPTGQVVGSLFKKCLIQNKKSNFVPRSFVFLGTNLPTRWGRSLHSIAIPGSGVSCAFSIKNHGRFTSRLLFLQLAPDLEALCSLRVNMSWNCQNLKAAS